MSSSAAYKSLAITNRVIGEELGVRTTGRAGELRIWPLMLSELAHFVRDVKDEEDRKTSQYQLARAR